MKLSSKCECQDHLRWKRPKPERVEEAIGPTSYQENSWMGISVGSGSILTNGFSGAYGFSGACGASIPHQKPEIINSYGMTGSRPPTANWIQAHKEKAKVDTTTAGATGWVPPITNLFGLK